MMKRIRTTTIPALGLMFIILAWAQAHSAQAAPEPQSQRPNIVLIVADDMGYNDVACFGAKPILTPHLDKLASQGVRATSFYVAWPACTPSRGSILTGRYPQRNGLYEMIRNDMVNYGHRYTEQEYAISPEMTLGLDVREVVVAQVLKQAGYATGIVGKWDSGRARRFLPLQRGFDFFYGFANTGIDYFTHERYGIPSMFRNNERTEADKGTYATELFRREAVQFIEDHHDRPFFLYLPFNAPHSASSFAETKGKAKADAKKGRANAGKAVETSGIQATPEYLARYPQMNPKQGLTRYMAAVTQMDAAIGAVLETLAKHNLERNTLVIFISDNGGSGNGGNAPLRAGKAQLYEGGVRVPFLARWPGRLPAGKSTDAFLSTLELFPTLATAAGAPLPAGVKLDGFDMIPILRGDTPSPRAEMYWEQHGNRSARHQNWKWISLQGKPDELYDLSADIGENSNLAADKPDVLVRMRERYADWWNEMEASEPRGPFRNY